MTPVLRPSPPPRRGRVRVGGAAVSLGLSLRSREQPPPRPSPNLGEGDSLLRRLSLLLACHLCNSRPRPHLRACVHPAAADRLLPAGRRAGGGGVVLDPAGAAGGAGEALVRGAAGSGAYQSAERDLGQPRLLCRAGGADPRRLSRQPRSAGQSAAADGVDAVVDRPDPRARAVRQSVALPQSVGRAVPIAGIAAGAVAISARLLARDRSACSPSPGSS